MGGCNNERSYGGNDISWSMPVDFVDCLILQISDKDCLLTLYRSAALYRLTKCEKSKACSSK